MEYTLIPEVSLASQTLMRGESLTARLASRIYLRVWSARLPWSDVIFSLPLSSPVRLVRHGGRRLIHIHHEPTAVSTVSEKSERDTHWNNLCGTFSSSLSRAIHESRAEYESSAGFTSTPAGMTWTMYSCWLHSNRTDIDTMKEIGGFICSSYSSLPFLVSHGQTLPWGRVWSNAKHARSGHARLSRSLALIPWLVSYVFAGRGRKRVLEDASTGEDTPVKSGGVRRERVKRVKDEGSLVQRSDGVKQINKRRLDWNIQQKHVHMNVADLGWVLTAYMWPAQHKSPIHRK